MNSELAVARALVVERISLTKQLDAVKEIHCEHKSILGFMPDGAFDDRFANRQIYLATIDNSAAGYVLFWRNRSDEIRIAHLAVRNCFQRLGVANALVDRLKKDHESCARIRLNCRSDFAAALIWPKLDFLACGRKPAKQPGKELTIFQYRLNDTPLYTELLPHPLSFTRANEILMQTGMKANQFQSALRITPPTFHQLYDELTKAS